MSILRSVSLLALLGTVAAADAAVRYTFDFSFIFTNKVTVTTATFLAAAQSFGPTQVDSADIFISDFDGIRFDPQGGGRDLVHVDYSILGVFPDSLDETFDDGAFLNYGSYTSASGLSTLTVSNVASAVPGPMAALPFALIALKRRRA